MKLLNFSKYKLIFFDFDGVIADTEWQHFFAFNKILRDYGVSITKEEYLKKYLAYDDKGCFKKIFKVKLKKNIDENKLNRLIIKKTKILMSKLRNGFKLYNDTIKFIQKLTSKFPNIKLCIVSGALRREIVYVLKKINLYKNFLFIISAEDVKEGKPSKEPFVFAKKKAEDVLNKKIKKEEILVVEDSKNGIKAAKSAGFDVLAVAHTYSINDLKKTSADFIVKRLTQIDI